MKRTFISALIAVTAAVLLLVLTAPAPAPLPQGIRGRRDILLLMTDNDTGPYFLQLRQGVEAAARQMQAQFHLAVVPPADMAQSIPLINPTAALLFFENRALEEEAQALLQQRRIPWRHLSHGEIEGVHMDEAAGAYELARLLPMNHAPLVVQTRENDITRRRLTGIAPLFDGMPSPLTLEDAPPLSLKFAKACLALDEESTRTLVAWKQQGRLPLSLLIYGWDTGESRVHDLDKGFVHAMLLPIPYALGVRGAESAIQNTTPALPIGRVVTKRTMLLSHNVRLVFPLLQAD